MEFYGFDEKTQAFAKIPNNLPLLSSNEWGKAVSNDPIKFTLVPNKPTAALGEEIELTLTAELLDISPRLHFTLEELRTYAISVILPQDFIQTGGTYYGPATGTLSPTNPKQTYTIKGRYLDKPTPEDCFKVLRKLNEEVFVLKNTACVDVRDIDVVSSVAENVSSGREVLTAIDLSKISIISLATRGVREITYFGSNNANFYYNCDNDGNDPVLNTRINHDGYNEITSKGGSYKWILRYVHLGVPTLGWGFSSFAVSMPFGTSSSSYVIELNIYSGLNFTGTLLATKTQEITIDRGPCPTTNALTISANETALCPGASATLTTSTNCPAASISWQKDGIAYGTNGVGTTVTTSGAYKAVCNSPAMVSNIITVTVSNSPSVPNVTQNRYAITPGEFATLTATNCQGTVVWSGSNNFSDVGDEISVNRPGNYQAQCRANCNGTVFFSGLSSPVNIGLLPLRLEADKYEKYTNETAQVSAFGCANGFIAWRVNGTNIPQSDNPLTAYAAGVYSAQCRSFNGPESDWVSLYIAEKTSNSPSVRASKTHAYPTDNVVLSAAGCPDGWYYRWEIPVRASNGTVTIQRPVGTPQTVQGPATYKVQCILNDQNQSAYESVTVNTLDVGSVIINITSNKTEANVGESVIFTVTGNCPNGGGIRWFVNGMNYWTWVGETYQGVGPGTYSARCESGPQVSPTVYYTVRPPRPGGISIVSDKPRAKENELVTLRAVGCDNEVNWTLPDGTEVQGSSVLFNFGPGIYQAKCVNRFGFTSPTSSLTIAPRNWDEPSVTLTNTSVATNQLGEMQIHGCPNDWVSWAVPRKDANGNVMRDANGQIIYDITDGKILTFRGPGVYKVRCSIGGFPYWFQEIVVQAAPTNALFLKPSRNVAKPDETVKITAYGCPNGVVQWKNGNLTATGVQLTVTGPGVRMARCVGDYSNNGDWALAQIRNDGNITPYLNASVTEACPNQPVTITATGCPNGWWYQTRWIKPDKLDFWLANRNAPIWEVYNYGSSNETRNGPNIYSARCISPDGSWHGDFNEKSITVEPAFPDDLRATNNGPALTGDPSVRLAVTNVPDVSYAWAGPNGFVSGIRNPEITALSAAKSGIYTVTLTKGAGQTWGCGVTATTEIVINGCDDLKIKATNYVTSLESYELPMTNIANAGQYDPLVLTVINSKGNQVQQNVDFRWKNPQGEEISLANLVYVRKEGLYTVNVSYGAFSCGLGVRVDEVTFQEKLDWVFYPLSKTKVTTGILYDRVLPVAKLLTFNTTNNTSDNNHFEQSYSELYQASYDRTLLLNPEDYDNVEGDYKYQKKVPLGLIYAKFNVFDDNALTNNIVIKKGDQLFDSPTNTTSPYLIKNTIVASALIDEVRTGLNRFVFSPYTYMNNTGVTLNKLKVNFGDGNPIANLSLGDEVLVNYTSPGQKTLTFIAEFTNGTTQTTYSNLKVTSISAGSTPGDEEFIDAKIAFIPYVPERRADVKGRGQIGYYYNIVNGVEDKSLNKVVIILDGFDPKDKRGFAKLYDEQLVYGNNQNIIEDLKEDGYDVLVLNFPTYPIDVSSRGPNIMRDGGADYIERNAFVLIELIEQVKLKLAAAGSTEKIVIIGPSMGGLISRYALSYMEKNNMNHRCKLWVSFDSPHRGANINIADQLMFEYLNKSLGFVGSVRDAVYELSTVGSQQILIHHFKAILEPQITTLSLPDLEKIAGSPNFRNRFESVMDNIGFPTSTCIRNVALINGTDLGTFQSREINSPNPASCSQALNITLGFAPSNFIFQLLSGNSGPRSVTMTAFNSPSFNERCKVFDGTVIGWNIFSQKKYSRYVKGNGHSSSLDIISGGYYAVNDEIPSLHLPILNVTKNFSKQSFIPSFSAMAISPIVGNIDWGSNLSFYRSNPTSGTPFKKIYAPATNENHVTVTAAGVGFIRAQILLAPPNNCN